MNGLRRRTTPLCLMMTVLMLLTSVPLQPLAAAMVGTGAFVEGARPAEAQDTVARFLDRQDVRALLTAQGVDPAEARHRLQALSNAEIQRLAQNIENLPAGGDAIGLVIGVLIIVLLVVVILRLV